MEEAATAQAAKDQEKVMRAFEVAGIPSVGSSATGSVDIASAAAELKSKQDSAQRKLDQMEQRVKESQQEVLLSARFLDALFWLTKLPCATR